MEEEKEQRKAQTGARHGFTEDEVGTVGRNGWRTSNEENEQR